MMDEEREFVDWCFKILDKVQVQVKKKNGRT